MIKNYNLFTNTVDTKSTSFRVMDFIMFNLTKYLQVFNTIIGLISIYVVDMFSLFKRSTKIYLHNMSMFQNSFKSTEGDINIPLFISRPLTSSQCFGKGNSTFNRTILPNIKPFFLRAINWFIKNSSTHSTFFSLHKNIITSISLVCNIKVNKSAALT